MQHAPPRRFRSVAAVATTLLLAFTATVAAVVPSADALASPRLDVRSYGGGAPNQSVIVIGWPIGSTITLTIDDTDNGVGVDDTQVVPSFSGDVSVSFAVPIDAGDIVTATGSGLGAGVDRSIVVADPTIDTTASDPTTDVIVGTATPGATVDVELAPEGTGTRTTVALGDGTWSADFSVVGAGGEPVVDVTPGTQLLAHEHDADGDRTTVASYLPDRRFRVWLAGGPQPSDLEAHDWPIGETLTLTVDDPATGVGVDHTEQALVGSGFAWGVCCGMGTAVFHPVTEHDYHIPRFAHVTVSGPSGTKSTDVVDLHLASYDAENDVVTGTAPTGVEIFGYDGAAGRCRHDVADGAGEWTLDYSVATSPPCGGVAADLDHSDWVHLHAPDDDGDETAMGSVSPKANAKVDTDVVEAQSWPNGRALTMTVDDADTGPGVDVTRTGVAGDGGPWWGDYRGFDLHGVLDLEPGDTVEVTDGVVTKSSVLVDDRATVVDPVNDLISGYGPPGSHRTVVAYLGSYWNARGLPGVVANESGAWTADFGADGYDITYRTGGWVQVQDPELDETITEWHWPRVTAYVFGDRATLDGLVPGQSFDVTVDHASNGVGVDWSTTVVGDIDGLAEAVLPAGQSTDRGDTVVVGDLLATKTLVLTDARATSIDLVADTVAGTATPGTTVDISPCFSGVQRHATADGTGAWSVDFSTPGAAPDEQDLHDIVGTTVGCMLVVDPDLDTSVFRWGGPPLAPTSANVVAGDASAVVTWSPAETEGLPILEYEVLAEPVPGLGAWLPSRFWSSRLAATPITVTVPGDQLDATVSPLVNGVTYAFTVTARNAAGDSPAADAGEATPSTCGDPATFSDVLDGHPFCEDIDWLSTSGVTTGYADGTFRPAASITRQAMVAFLYRLAGSPDGDDPSCTAAPFEDVPTSHAFCGEIEWAVDAGLANGYADGTFRPAALITRQAMAALLYRLAGEPAFTPPPVASFTDVPTAHAFFHEIEWMTDVGITGGYPDGSFGATRSVSRQAMAAFLHRYVLGGFTA